MNISRPGYDGDDDGESMKEHDDDGARMKVSRAAEGGGEKAFLADGEKLT